MIDINSRFGRLSFHLLYHTIRHCNTAHQRGRTFAYDLSMAHGAVTSHFSLVEPRARDPDVVSHQGISCKDPKVGNLSWRVGRWNLFLFFNHTIENPGTCYSPPHHNLFQPRVKSSHFRLCITLSNSWLGRRGGSGHNSV
jgi:hypothetical protein